MDELGITSPNELDSLCKENQNQNMFTERLEIRKNSFSDEVNHMYDIALKTTKQKIGWVNMIKSDTEGYTEIWYSIGDSYKNHGFCTEAVEFLITNNPSKLFYISTWTANKASMCVCKKLRVRLANNGFKSYCINECKFYFERVTTT